MIYNTMITKKQFEFIKEHGITEDQFFGREKIEGDLILAKITSLPDGFSPKVKGRLLLGRLASIPDGFSPIVDGDLLLGNITSLPNNFSLTVGGSLDLRGLTRIPYNLSLNVGKDLYLTSISDVNSMRDLKTVRMQNIKTKGDIYFAKFNTKNPDTKELTFEDVVEDVCQPGEKVIIYQKEDFMSYGIVSEEDAERLKVVYDDVYSYCNNSKEYQALLRNKGGWTGLLDVFVVTFYDPGTCIFSIGGPMTRAVGGIGPYNEDEAKANINKFETITKTDGEDIDVNGENEEHAFTLSRDYINTYRSPSGAEEEIDIDTVIEYVEEAKFDLIESFRDFGFPDCNIKGIKPVRLLNVMYKRNFNSGILQDFDKSEYYK